MEQPPGSFCLYLLSTLYFRDMILSLQYSFEIMSKPSRVLIAQLCVFNFVLISASNFLLGQQTALLEPARRASFLGTGGAKEFAARPDVTYGTYFGGSGDDFGTVVAADASGNIIIAGTSRSDSLPGTNGSFQPNRAPGLPDHANAFVAKFDPTGRRLLWSTFLGGDGTESLVAIAVERNGNIIVAGTTSSTNFPTTSNAYQRQSLTNQVASYVTKIAADGRTLVFSTYLKQVSAMAMTINDAGDVYVTGQSYISFGTSPAEHETPGSIGSIQPHQVQSVFLIRLRSDGTGLVYGANLGGGGFDGSAGTSITLDPLGNCYVAGVQKGNTGQGNSIVTSSGSYQPSYSNSGLTNSVGPGALDNGFVVAVNNTGTKVIFGTYFGPRFYGTAVQGIAVDPNGGVYFDGRTNAPTLSLPVTAGAYGTSPTAVGGTGFIAHLRADGTAIDRFSYLPSGSRIKRGVDDSLYVGTNLRIRGQDFSLINLLPFELSDVVPIADRSAWLVGTANANSPFVALNSSQPAPNGGVDAILIRVADIQPTVATITSSSGVSGGSLAPGQLVSIFGSELGATTGISLHIDSLGRLDSVLGETRVLFDGSPAPLLYARSDQVNTIVPFATAGHASTEVVVEYKGVQSKPVTVPIVETAPGIFTVNGKGSGQGAFLNQDGSLNSRLNAAPRGSIVALYATGAGLISPAVDGRLAGSDLPKLLLPAIVGIDNAGAEVLYAGAAPGLVAGVIQVNVRIPIDTRIGDAIPVVLRVGNAYSQPVTLAVRDIP